MILYAVLLFGIVVTTAAEHFIPPLEILRGARVMLMPILLFYGAVAFPYPAALSLAFVGGLFYDLVTMPFSEGAVEFSPGWSIILFGLLCTLMHGMRPLFLRGRWEVHCLVCGILVVFIPLAQFVFLSFRRESFIFDAVVWWRIGGPGLVAALLSPFFFGLLNLLWTPGPPEEVSSVVGVAGKGLR